ncbi:MAG: UMP kinase [Clostridiales bacterium]|nr:UMP kinase [Candidatus Coliplasma caballi]
MLKPKYKRILLKLSGEALAGEHGILDDGFLKTVCAEIRKCTDAGVQVAIVIGAGNIWRGARQGGLTIDRVRGDHMGMLATVINSLAMQDYLIGAGVDAKVMSAFQIQQVCEPYAQYKAIEYLEQGKAVLIPCGVGYPYFSTDTGMMLRAVELKCDVLLSAKNVDGVYDDDPAKNPNAKKYETLTYDEILAKGLHAIDLTASAIGRENGMPALIFGLSDPANITRAVFGENVGTLITH